MDMTNIKSMHCYRSFHQNIINQVSMSICSHSVAVAWPILKLNDYKKRTALKCACYLYTYFEINLGNR